MKRTDYICPECGEDMDIDAYDWEVDVDCVSIKMSCNKCDAVWREYFLMKYDGYSYDGHFYDANGEKCDL